MQSVCVQESLSKIQEMQGYQDQDMVPKCEVHLCMGRCLSSITLDCIIETIEFTFCGSLV